MEKMEKMDLNGEKIALKRFNLDTMCKHPSIVMVAKRGSGKSVAVRDLLYHFKDIPMGIIIAPTDRMDCYYGKFFPDSYIYYSYKTEIIEKLLSRQLKIKEKNEARIKAGKTPIDTRAFLVMDDCLASKGEWAKDEPIKELLFNGRHYDVMYILTMQFSLSISPELRTNFDYIFLLADDFPSNQKRMFDHYAGMFQNFDHFKQVFLQLTSDFGAMVVANRGARTVFWEKVFWYKAILPVAEDINFGHKEFREFHKNNYNEAWRQKKQLFDVEDYYKKKRKNYNIKKIG
jgi:hypothetical protein